MFYICGNVFGSTSALTYDLHHLPRVVNPICLKDFLKILNLLIYLLRLLIIQQAFFMAKPISYKLQVLKNRSCRGRIVTISRINCL